jgi:hypothetical protein
VSQGKSYCGPIDVLGTAFDACYNPIRDGAGKVVGLTCIGHEKWSCPTPGSEVVRRGASLASSHPPA